MLFSYAAFLPPYFELFLQRTLVLYFPQSWSRKAIKFWMLMWWSLTKWPHAHKDKEKQAFWEFHCFFFVTKTSQHSVGPKSLRWVGPFPLICWCSFLERKPVCVTTATDWGLPAPGKGQRCRFGEAAGAAEARHPAWPNSSESHLEAFVSPPAISVCKT